MNSAGIVPRSANAVCRSSTKVVSGAASREIEIYRPQGEDLQQPHEQDEVYFIASSFGRFEHEETIEDVEAGDVLFVAAGERHRFVDFSPDFATWVVLYGPAGGE